MYLIVIEALSDLGGAMPPPIYFHQPYRLAATVDEAAELMRDYMQHHHERDGDLIPKYFAVYKEMDGRFGFGRYFDPQTLAEVDATEWLADTGRC